MAEAPEIALIKSLRAQARALIRTHDTESLISEAILCLREAHAGGNDVKKKYQPWHVLLAVKWILQESDSTAYLRLPAQRTHVHRILNFLHEIEGNVRMPTQFDSIHLFMRQIAFQQFWLRDEPDGSAVARQDILFASLPKNHTFQRRFTDLTGLTISEYLDLSFAMIALTLKGPGNIGFKKEAFSNLAPRLSPGAVDRFLLCTSKTTAAFHTWLSAAPFAGMEATDERIVRTPLLDHPLLDVNGTHIPFYIPLLLRNLEAGVYRILRAADRSDFGLRFGKLFEKYLDDCLVSANIRFTREEQLRGVIGQKTKCVDFMIVDEDCTVLIDAKAVEMSDKGRLTHRAEIVLGALRDSAMKGIYQGQETMRELRQLTRTAPLAIGRHAAFLIVVTFDNLYLGSGTSFDATYGHVVRPQLQDQFGEDLPIPLEHVFFISVDEFERLLARVRLGQCNIVGALRYARDQDSDLRTRRFDFNQHLEAICPQEERLPVLQAGLERVASRAYTRATQAPRK